MSTEPNAHRPQPEPGLSPTALRMLKDQLAAAVPGKGNSPRTVRDHRGLVHRAAVSVRLAPRWLDRVPNGVIPYQDVRVFILTYRWNRDFLGRVRPRPPRLFAPAVDLYPDRPGSGRVLWTPRNASPEIRGRVWDMTGRDTARKYAIDADKPEHLSAARLGLLLDQACCDYEGDTVRSPSDLRLPRFLYCFNPAPASRPRADFQPHRVDEP